MRKKQNNIAKDLEDVAILSFTNCEGEFHILPFIIQYLFAYERLELRDIKHLEQMQDDIVIHQHLDNNSTRALTTCFDSNNPTDNLIKETVARTLNKLSYNIRLYNNVLAAMFALYDCLKVHHPCEIKKHLSISFSNTIKYFFNVTSACTYYKVEEDKFSFHELSKLMLLLLTKGKKRNYSILHKFAGSANFIEHLTDNICYHANFQEEYVDFLCLYQMFSIVTNKKTNLYHPGGLVGQHEKTDAIIIDDSYIEVTEFWSNIVSTIKNGQEGIFLAESDTLLEFKNSKLIKSLEGVDILSYVNHVIFLPKSLILVLVCKKKDTEDVILHDETYNRHIYTNKVLDNFNHQRNAIRLKKEEYQSHDFVFTLKHILSKRNTSDLKKESNHIIPLKDLLSPSKVVGPSILNPLGIESHDHNYSRFFPFYIVENDCVINIRDLETIRRYQHYVLLINSISKHRYQPKILCYNKFEGNISMDESAFNIALDKIDLNYLINEMNKKYFTDQIFPTYEKAFVELDWSYLQQCCIELPNGADTITPIERQKNLLNAERMDFINQVHNSYNYDIERILESGTQELPTKTKLLGGTYTIVDSIKDGGFGKIYKAIKKNEDGSTKVVALKEFFYKGLHKRDRESNDVIYIASANENIVKVRRNFFEEAQKISLFKDCPNIVKVFDVFDENNTSYYSMEYLDGKNLYDYVIQEKNGSLCEKEAIKIIRGVANALIKMHKVQMLHMDVNPNNIIVCKDGRVVLIDFGGSHGYTLLSKEGFSIAILNSPGYTPPEGLTNRVNDFAPTYDIYSLGATLKFMLSPSGESECSQMPGNYFECSVTDEQINNISKETMNCITKSLKYYPKDRPQTIEDFLAMLPFPLGIKR